MYNGTPLSSLKIPRPMGELDPPSNTWFSGPTRVLNPNGISIGSAVFAGLTSVTDRLTDRPTDHATRSVAIGRMYLRSAAMRSKNPEFGVMLHRQRAKKYPYFFQRGTT